MRLLAIDFEATCDEPYNPDPQEIIEFPAVLVDPGGRTAEFHSYVRPTAHPKLSPFCQKLTGITQGQVDPAPPFPEVLRQFEEWRTKTCPDALVVTSGNWDLASMLPRACAQHGLDVPKWADRWADMRQLYAENYPRGSDRSTQTEIASGVGVALEGRLHSGIDDARNIARVVRRMMEQGVIPENTAVWRCSGCGRENLLRDRACVGCGKARVALKPGDWACGRCGCANHARRDRCFDCGARR